MGRRGSPGVCASRKRRYGTQVERKSSNILGSSNDKQIVFTFYYPLHCGLFCPRMSYAMARTPILPLFALTFGAKPEAIGFVVGASTITGIFFKLPAGTLSDIYGRYKMLLISILVFALTPFVYYLVTNYWQLVGIRFFSRTGDFNLWPCVYGNDRRYCRWTKGRKTFLVFFHYHYRKPCWGSFRWIYPPIPR